MDSNNGLPSHLRPGPTSPASTVSTSIVVGTTSEEELYAAAGHALPVRKPAPSLHSNDNNSQERLESTSRSVTSNRSNGSLQSRELEDNGPLSPNGSNPLEFGTDMDNYPASMTSSIRQHVYEGGLRYHAFQDGRYAFPNDDVEQNRDDMKHTMTLLLCKGKHFYAPIEKVLKKGGKVLDLGTGTGIWAMEVGEAYENTTITGLDLSPIQPNYVPDNVHFFVDDFEMDWVDDENTFDFIHIRHTLHSVRDRAALLERAYKHLKPGGYLEVQELHFSPHCDDDSVTDEVPYAFRDFMRFLAEGLRALGGELHAIVTMPDEMREAGFEEVNVIQHKNPIGVWPRDKRLRLCGLFLRTAIMDGLRGLSRRPFGTGLGWTQVQIEMFLIEVRKSVMDSKFHTYFPLHVVYGRKPLK